MLALSKSPLRQDEAVDSAGPAPRLLIVDDIADNRAILARRFVKRGFEIAEAVCGEDALRLIESQSFDVVLLDVMMPGMDGLEVLRRVRAQKSAAELPVVMVTANALSQDVASALEIGANDYVTKPVDFPVALARVSKQVAARRAEMAARGARDSLREENTGLANRIAESRARLEHANAAVQAELQLRLQSEDRIAYLAHHDVLTGLANRFSFEQSVGRALAASQRGVSLLFIDLDGFKSVNDTLGHAAGDEVLREVAGRLAEISGRNNCIARLGGDEFGLLHASSSPHDTAEVLADSVIRAIAGRYAIFGNQVYIGASIGIAVATEHTVGPDELLKQADLAMYQAKSEGRGAYRFYEAEMQRRAEERRLLEIDLHQATADCAFEMHYQPFVDLKDRKVAGFEALIRWRRGDRGFVPPGEFIALAEENGLIMRIGEWALRQACRDAAKWPETLRIAVNLSPVQFRHPDLVAVVVDALRETGVNPSRLELEITESMLLRDNEQVRDTFRRLRELGVKFSLDDFGAGYTGLGYFRSFRFDRVKIDRSFIQEMVAQPECLAIVRAAVGIGATLGMSTTAEGVENAEQLASLLEIGCGEAQGFLFSRPAPCEEVAEIYDSLNTTFAWAV